MKTYTFSGDQCTVTPIVGEVMQDGCVPGKTLCYILQNQWDRYKL